MQHGAAVGDAQHVEDRDLAGLGVELDLGEGRGQARRDADARQVVLGDADQAGARDHVEAVLGDGVDVLRRLLAGELAAELDRLLRRLSVGDRLRRIGLADHLLRSEVIVGGRAAEHLGGDVGQLRLGVHRRDIHGARLGRGGEAAGLVGVPGQAAAGVAALDDHIVPVVVEHVGRDPRGPRVGVGAEIADAGMDVQLAVRRDAHHAVEAVRAGGVIALADADAGHLGAVALAGLFLLLLPLEHLGALVQRLLLEGAGQGTAIGADLGGRVGRIHAPDREPVDVELLRRLVDHRLEDRRRTGSRRGRAAGRPAACW